MDRLLRLHTVRWLLAGLLLALLLPALPAVPARAGTLTVTNTNDSGPGSLRQAIADAAAGDTIEFQAGLSGTITLTSGTLTLTKDVTIDGTGATVTVDGNCINFEGICTSGGVITVQVNAGVTARLSNLTIQHGGSGIENSGTLTVTYSTVSGNGSGVSGGGIDNLGTLTVIGSTLANNSSTASGGAIHTGPGTLTVTNSTISGNIASNGGAIFGGGTMTITNSTISGNHSTGSGFGAGFLPLGGPGIFILGGSSTLSVTNSTIAGNIAAVAGSSGGAAIYNPTAGLGTQNSTVILSNTIVAANQTPDLGGLASGNNNLIGDSTISLLTGTNNLNAAPLLGTLGNYGGPTQTIPLLPGSPAIAHGDPAACASPPVGGKDQRGVTRPSALCAIGAFEPLLSAVSPTSGFATGGTLVTLTGAGYAAGATVTLGGVACTNVAVVNSTTLTCTTGASATGGAVDVVVTVNGQSGTLAQGYTYLVPAALPTPRVVPPSGNPPGSLPEPRGGGPIGGSGTPLPAPAPRSQAGSASSPATGGTAPKAVPAPRR